MLLEGVSDVSGGGRVNLPMIGRARGLGVADVSPRYAELVKTGRCFSGGTAVSGVAPGTAIGTTAPFSLYNPSTSYNLIVLSAEMAYLSGTLGIGFVDWVANVDSGAAAVTGTAITARNLYLGNGTSAVGKPLTTATLPAAPTFFRRFVNLPPILATTVLTPWIHRERVDGDIIVGAGCTLSLEGTAAGGSSPLVCYTISWYEEAL